MAVTLAWLASPVKHAAPAVLVTLKRKCPNPLLAAALGLAIACGSDSTGPSGRPGPFASVSGRGFHTCGLTTAGDVYCWGENTGGILGVGETGDQLVPAQVPMPAGLTFASLSAGTYFTCGLTPNGMAHCWGDNQFGQLGDGTTMNRLVPVAVALPAGVTFTSVSASIPYHAANAFICGLAPAGTAYCWGGNDRGQLGNGSTAARSTPEAVLLPAGVTFASLGTGAGHACGLTTTGNVYCWGANDEGGQLGDGTTMNRLTPVAVIMPIGVTFASLSVGGHHTCGLTSSGAAYCWGFNVGRLGDGTTVDRLTPTAVVMPSGVIFRSLVAGYNHTCAVTLSGEAYCWGRNSWGQVGDGTEGSGRYEPVAVAMPPGETFTTLTAGWMFGCGLTPRGAAYCWGLNNHGQLGDGTMINRLVPVVVVQ